MFFVRVWWNHDEKGRRETDWNAVQPCKIDVPISTRNTTKKCTKGECIRDGSRHLQYISISNFVKNWNAFNKVNFYRLLNSQISGCDLKLICSMHNP
jgi:hypothetical protein